MTEINNITTQERITALEDEISELHETIDSLELELRGLLDEKRAKKKKKKKPKEGWAINLTPEEMEREWRIGS